jgi:transcriptional regulator with XRE-family HTH domain
MAIKQPSMILREARDDAGITQAELAERLGLSQPAVAALERAGANPTVRTLERALNALGKTLTVGRTDLPDVDEAQIRAHLALTPAERLRTMVTSSRKLDAFLAKARDATPDG